MLEVRLLGRLAAAMDGRPVELPADARARELLARLALAAGPQPRSALAGRLRPDVSEESARKTLRNALYELRRAFGEDARDAVVVDGDRIGLAEDVRVDVREFRRHLRDGALEAAAQAGAGELLDGFDGDWALRAREEHAAELARVLAALAARAEEAGDPAGAAAWARRRIEVEPLSEAAHRELIRLLALSGDRPAALAAAKAMGERLRTELGLPASAATRALVEDVRRGKVAPAAPAPIGAPPLPAALAAGARPEGRAPELERLERAWAEAAQGAMRVAVATGEPGIGKTTLAGELARRVHAGGGAVLLGRSDEHALVPFRPWIEALERLLDALPPAEADGWLSAHDGALARLLPARAPIGAPAGGPRERYLAFELARALLDELAARRPVLLVLDDLHWADADTLALLRHLGRSGVRRLMVLICARGAELEPAAERTLAELRREGPLFHVELAGLDDDAVGALLARRGGAADARAARRLRERTGGNPLFLDEVMREAEERGGQAELPPAGVREVVARRLARLGEPTRRTLELAAIRGLEFDAATLAAADGRDVVDVLEALDGAIEAALVLPTDRRGRYAFAHALVGETIAGGMRRSQRERLHLRLADVLAEAAASAGEVVRHLRAAGALAGDERLTEWELAAAREASAALAHGEAAGHYEAALALGAAVTERDEVLLALGDAQDRAGRRTLARAAFAQAAEAAPDAAALARAALGHGGRGVVIAAADEATVRLLEDALARVPAGEHATAARLLARLAIELYYADWGRSRELGERAVERAQASGDAAALAAALNAHRVAIWAPEHADERLATATEMLAAAERAGDREAMLQARNWRVVDLLELGRTDEAAAEVDAYAALADEVALPHFRWYVPLWRGTLAMLAGHWTEVTARGDEALALGGQAEDPNAPLFVGIQRANGLYAQRRMADGDRQRLVDEAAVSPVPADWLVNLALHDAETGALDDARRLVSELSRDGCAALRMDANWHSACVLAEAAAIVGDREAGASLYALLEPHARLFPLVARAVGCLGSAELYLGRVADLLGRPDEALDRYRRAAEANDRAGAAAHTATALFRLGEALSDRPEGGRAAREVLQQAARWASELCMPGLAAQAARLLGTTPA